MNGFSFYYPRSVTHLGLFQLRTGPYHGCCCNSDFKSMVDYLMQHGMSGFVNCFCGQTSLKQMQIYSFLLRKITKWASTGYFHSCIFLLLVGSEASLLGGLRPGGNHQVCPFLSKYDASCYSC